MSDSLKILKDFSNRMKKAMSPEVLHSLVKKHRFEHSIPDFQVTKDSISAREIGSRSVGGNFERVILPTEHVRAENCITKSESHTDCLACGYVYKSSINSCPKCVAKSEIKEAIPFYKR